MASNVLSDTKKATLAGASPAQLLDTREAFGERLATAEGVVKAGLSGGIKRINARIEELGGEVDVQKQAAAERHEAVLSADCADPEGHADQLEAIGECGTCHAVTPEMEAILAEQFDQEKIKAAQAAITADVPEEDAAATEPAAPNELRPVSVNDTLLTGGGGTDEAHLGEVARALGIDAEDPRLVEMATDIEGPMAEKYLAAVKLAGKTTKSGAPKTVQVEKGEYFLAGGAFLAVHFNETPKTSRWVVARVVDLGENRSLVAVPWWVAKTWDDVVALFAAATAPTEA